MPQVYNVAIYYIRGQKSVIKASVFVYLDDICQG
jgi:hypothetical protein